MNDRTPKESFEPHPLFVQEDDTNESVNPAHIGHIRLSRFDGGSPVLLGSYAPTELSNHDVIRERFGGGRYEVRAINNGMNKKQKGCILGRSVFTLPGPPKNPWEPPSAPATVVAAEPMPAARKGLLEQLAEAAPLFSSAAGFLLELRSREDQRRREDEERREERRREDERRYREEEAKREEARTERRREDEERAAQRRADEQRAADERRAENERWRIEEQRLAEERMQMTMQMLKQQAAAPATSANDDMFREILKHTLSSSGKPASILEQVKNVGELKKLLKDGDDGELMSVLGPLLPLFAGRLLGGGGGMPPGGMPPGGAPPGMPLPPPMGPVGTN